MSSVNALRFRSTPTRSDRFDTPKRDENAMDLDSPYAHSGSPHGFDERPSRKRHHGENGPTPFAPSPFITRQPAAYNNHNNNAPFLFSTPQSVAPQVPPLPPFSQYDPNTLRFDMGAQGSTSMPPPKLASWAVEVDMDDPTAGPSSLSSSMPVHEDTIFGRPGNAGPAPSPPIEESAGPEQAKQVATVSDEKDEDEQEQRPIARGAVSRVRKRRAKEWKKRYDTDTEGEEEYSRRGGSVGPSKTEQTIHHHHNLNAPGMRHSEVPALLLGYLQFFVNASIVLFILYLVLMFVMTVRRDVQDRMAEASIELLQEISECTQLYLTNRCDPAVRVPAMETACKTWDICMHRDATMIGRTNVMAETFAGVINAFVEQISWKTMASYDPLHMRVQTPDCETSSQQQGFTLVTLSFMVTLANSALFNLRQSASLPIDPQPYYPPAQGHGHGHLGWHPYGQPGQPGQGMPSMGMMQNHPHGQVQDGMHASPGQDITRQIGWEEPKKKGWLW